MEILTLETLPEAEQFIELCENPNLNVHFSFNNHVGAMTSNQGSLHWISSGKLVDYKMKFLQSDNHDDNDKCLSLNSRNGRCVFTKINCNTLEYKFICQSNGEAKPATDKQTLINLYSSWKNINIR